MAYSSMKIKPGRKKNDFLVYFDFDNTITTIDVLDDIIERFSVDKRWMVFEDKWLQGRIGSKECLIGQLKSVRITKTDLYRYLSSVKLDHYFKRLYFFLKKRNIQPVVLSDNFSPIIKEILRARGLKGIKLHANKIRFSGKRLFPTFPHANDECLTCGHCKKNNLLKPNPSDKIIYIGDGMSDVCPAEHADIVFAKGRLLKHFQKTNRKCIPFKDLKEVFRHIKGLL